MTAEWDVVAGVGVVAAAICTIFIAGANCEKASNPGPQCRDACGAGRVLRYGRTEAVSFAGREPFCECVGGEAVSP